MHRVALIGCGDVAERGHLPALLRHPAFSILAVCDTRVERAELLARSAGTVPVYTRWQTLLDRVKPDAVVLALPPQVSPDVAIACLDRGIPVLDEKPLAATLDQGRRVARAVAQPGRVYQVGFGLRYGDCIETIRQLAHDIATPARYHVAIYDELLDRSNVDHFTRIQSFLRDSSAMTHEGSHVIDYAATWNPSTWTRVLAATKTAESDLAGPNVWNALVSLADGSTLEIDIGWLLPTLPPCTAFVKGPHGRVQLNLSTGRGSWQIHNKSGTVELPPMAPEWDRQYDVFARAIQNGKAEKATILDGLRALEVSIACELSARIGKTVSLNTQDSLTKPPQNQPE
ncbi:MAG: Gfo/Idh/MocA family oxidoreductase [Sedimentisphaerales bacterium]|nr:Gfo/Idh/MocA family oxidoreductase [Sedimentisphaerales bacterium]